MLIPHNVLKPVRIQFTFSFAVTMLVLWTGLTSWATMAVMTNVDYWRMKVDHQVLKLKVIYFASELKRSRAVLGQVREADEQLRQLLGMQTRRSILEGEPEASVGGPEGNDLSLLAKTLGNRLWDISEQEIREESEKLVEESENRIESFKEISEYIAHERSLYRSTPKGWPAEGRLTSHFGNRVSPFHGHLQFHTGMDIANLVGTEVRATGDGVVQHADWEGGYGRLVIVNHGFGYLTYYGHNSKLLVKRGESVKRGQVIALMGSSGSSTGSHVHYEVWRNGRWINPWQYVTAESVEDIVMKKQRPARKTVAKAARAPSAPAAAPAASAPAPAPTPSQQSAPVAQ